MNSSFGGCFRLAATAARSSSSRSKTQFVAATATATVPIFIGATLSHPCARRFASSNAEKVATSAAEATVSSVGKTASSAASTASASASKKVPQTEKGGSSGLMKWYESHLIASPVRTKMVTGGILWGIGDMVAQVVPAMAFGDDEKTPPGSDAVIKKPFSYDYARSARAVFFGFAIHAPCSHVHFNFLEWMTVKAGISGLQIPIFKAFMEQFVYWSWLSNSLYHGAMGAMQGMNGQQIYDRIADVLWETQKAQWVFWIPVQLLNFRFVPVRHQLNVVLLTSIVWTALLSAWYPPEEDEEKGGVKKSIEAEKA